MTRVRAMSFAAILAIAHASAACKDAGEKPGASPYPAPVVESQGEVVAVVGPVVFTTAEIEKRISQQSPFLRAQLKDAEQRKKFIENEVRIEVLAQEGWRRGLDRDSRIQLELKKAIVQRVMRDDIAALQTKLEVTDEDLKHAYDKRQAEFVKPPMVRLSQILLARGEKARAEAMLKQLREDVKKNQIDIGFADAARKHSEDIGTRNGGGDLQFMTREQLVERLGKESADRWFDKEEVGTLGIEETDKGVLILRKTGARRGTERTIEQVKPQLRGQILNEKKQKAFDDLVEELKKKTNVTINEEAMKNIKVTLDAPTQPPENSVQPEEDDDE